MTFDYQITVDDYVACQLLYFKLALGRKRLETGITWIVVGVLSVFAAAHHSDFDWAVVLLGLAGSWCMCAGLSTIFPTGYMRRQYRKLTLSGKTFHAVVDAQGLEVTGEFCAWKIPWGGVNVRGENAAVFILYSDAAHTIFMFAKRYLSDEQQRELRGLAGLTSAHEKV